MNNPPAFARGQYTTTNSVGHETYHEGHEGMTLRDYFAAKALPTFIKELLARKGVAQFTGDDYNKIAQRAYFAADAMLKAREQ